MINRLFSRESKPSEPAPLIDLLVYRSSIPFVHTDTPEAHLFEVIPQLDKSMLQKCKLDTSLLAKLQFTFRRSDIEAISRYVGENQPTEVSCFVILYHCLCWHYGSNDKQVDDFITVIKALNMIVKCSPTLTAIRNLVFLFFVRLAISPSSKFKITNEVYHYLVLHLRMNTTLDSSYFNLMILLFKQIMNSGNEEYINETYEAIIHLFNVNSPFFDFNSLPSFFPILNISALNSQSLMILSKLTTKSDSTVLVNAYKKIPPALVSKLSTFKINHEYTPGKTNIPKIQKIPEKRRVFLDFGFSADFQPLQFKEISDVYNITELLSDEAQALIYDLTPALNICSKEAQKMLISKSLDKLLKMQPDKNFYQIAAALFFIIQKLIDTEFLTMMIPVITKTIIFSQAFSLFDQIPKEINTLRNFVFHLIETIQPEQAVLLISSLKESPLILTECFARLLFNIHLYQVDLFITKEMMEIITETGLSLQALPPSDVCFRARNTFFAFMNELYQTPQTAYDCFKSQIFCENFLWYIYEQKLTNHILITIKNALAIIPQHSELKHLQIFLRELIINGDDKLSQTVLSWLIDALQNNPTIVYNFISLLEPLLTHVEKSKNAQILEDCLLLLVLATMTPAFKLSIQLYKQFARCIRCIFGDEPSPKIEWLLFGALSSSISDPPLYLIRIPTIIPLILTVFSSSSRIMKIIDKFSKLISYSEHNKRACQVGDLVFILSQLILSNHVHYSNYEFDFKVSEVDKERVIYPLIKLISISQSDNSIAQFYVNNLDNPTVAKFLMDLLSECVYSTKPHFPIGKMPPQFSVKGIYPEDLKNGFTVHMSINIDHNSVADSSKPVDIMRLTDSDESFLSIFLVNGGISTKFEGNGIRTTVPLVKTAESCTFVDYTFVFQILEDRVRISSYKNLDSLNDSDFCQFEFSSGELTLSFGGYGHEYPSIQQSAVVTNFQIFPSTNVNHIDIVKRTFVVENQALFTSNCVNDPSTSYNFSVKREVNRNIKNCPNHLTINVNDSMPNPKNLLGIILSSNYSNQIASRFYIKGVLAIIRLLFQKSEWVQMEFNSVKFIHMHIIQNPSLINFQLYKELYLVFNEINYEKLKIEWFEILLVNIWLWGQATYQDLVQIISHWGKTLTFSYDKLFIEKSYFSTLLSQYRLLFCLDDEAVQKIFVNQFHETIKEKERSELSNFFLAFVGRVAFLRMDKSDVDIFFDHLFSSPSKQTLLNLFNLFYACSENVDTTNHFQHLLSFLGDDVDINEAVIIAIHYMFDKKSPLPPIISVFEKLNNKSPELFERLCKKLHCYPNLTPFMCLFARELNKVHELAELLYRQQQLIAPSIVSNEFWYIWPVMFGFSADREDAIKICHFIAYAISISENFNQDLQYTAVIISLAMFATKETNFLRLFISSFDAIDKTDENKIKAIVELCFHVCFFHFHGKMFHDFVLEEFNKVVPENEKITQKEHHGILENLGSLDDLRKLVKMSYTAINLMFQFRITRDKKWSDAHFAGTATNFLTNSAYENELFIQIFQYFTDPLLLGQKETIHKIQSELDEVITREFAAYSSSVKVCFSSMIRYLTKLFNTIKNNVAKNENRTDAIMNRLSNEICRNSSLNTNIINRNKLRPDSTFCEFFTPMKLKRSIQRKKYFRQILLGDVQNEFQCKLIKNSNEKPCVLKIYQKFIQIGKKFIDSNSLLMILSRRRNGKECMLEFFMLTGTSFLLDFSPSDTTNIVKSLQKLSFPNLTTFQKGSSSSLFNTQPTKPLWESGQISNFEYILLLNVFSGHSYHDKALEPVMPKLVENDDITKVINIAQGSTSVPVSYYLLPEQENDQGKKGKRDYEFLYKLRKMLESDSTSMKICTYIDSTFGYKLPGSTPFSQVLKKKQQPKHRYVPQRIKDSKFIRLKTKVLYGLFANPSKTEGATYQLSVISNDGLYKFIKVETIPTLKIEALAIIKYEPNDRTVYSGFNKKTFVYNRKKAILTTFNETKKEDEYYFFSETEFLACCEYNYIYCPNMCSIASRSTLNGQTRILWNSDNRIVHLAASSQFKMFAFATIQNDVSIHSINTGCEVSRVNIEHEIDYLLITPRWGFVIAMTKPEVVVLGTNGEIIKKVPFNDTCIHAYSFVPISGFDYIVYQNDKMQVFMFEAFYPDQKKLLIETNEIMKTILYDIHTSSLLVLFANGLIQMLPLNSIE
ncbi:hypothetical protein TRFO_09846 [Tritrichomonas foetus]|uniref:BEACH domain-containing protein n=1 Tax=Tritrichomonas foetus TaxID=1144522 RepID=A0A1J4JGB1_9EUKA|nr:hypothetical protein TRFO_09846 [Tritrichomonas foetus]|eukprot:OHS96683.1 hypothetical protein TRFO_09846 [Tritrichomonas foetus]